MKNQLIILTNKFSGLNKKTEKKFSDLKKSLIFSIFISVITKKLIILLFYSFIKLNNTKHSYKKSKINKKKFF